MLNKESSKASLNWPPEKTVRYSLEFDREEPFMEIKIDDGKKLEKSGR